MIAHNIIGGMLRIEYEPPIIVIVRLLFYGVRVKGKLELKGGAESTLPLFGGACRQNQRLLQPNGPYYLKGNF